MGVEAVTRYTDLDDSNAVEVDEILLLGQALGYYWGSWEPSAVLELLEGRTQARRP